MQRRQTPPKVCPHLNWTLRSVVQVMYSKLVMIFQLVMLSLQTNVYSY